MEMLTTFADEFKLCLGKNHGHPRHASPHLFRPFDLRVAMAEMQEAPDASIVFDLAVMGAQSLSGGINLGKKLSLLRSIIAVRPHLRVMHAPPSSNVLHVLGRRSD
eukprot:SAG11_NODE_8440_length_1015_cov_1.494541_2_plen_106_part_00